MKIFIFTLLISLLPLTGCVTNSLSRTGTAQNIALPSGMLMRQIPAPPFNLTIYEKIHAPSSQSDAPARIYIEGDGLAWLDRRTPSLDPTPTNPVALHLATRDNSPNVIYMARPCQYSKSTTGKACERKYWMGARFAPEVIHSMSAALDNIKARYNIENFDLIGYSGGGTVAALLAQERSDITSIRTVAGNLDHRAHSYLHDISMLKGSLNPADNALPIAHIPQLHFIGTNDTNVPRAIYDSFRAQSGTTSCVHAQMVGGASHEKGWIEQWPALLTQPVICTPSL